MNRIFCRTVLLLGVVAWLSGSGICDDRVPENAEPRWWKGNIHTHSLWSDGNDFPEMIAEWYRTRDYNFLAITDHNILSEGARWMKHDAIVGRNAPTALDKYIARFGQHWVETRGTTGTPDYEIRLKPLDEFRHLVEERGQFILIPAEEISDRAEGVPVHMNATNLRELVMPLGGATVREAMTNNLRAVDDQAQRTGREILLHLNHPNFGLAVTAEDLAAVTAERFFEVYNGHPGVGHLGDAQHVPVERMWDIANTIRLGELKAEPLLGVAVDDSHVYHGTPGSRPGRGWVMVRSRFLTPEHLIRAMREGDFYASSGVTLAEVSFDSNTGTLAIDVQAESGIEYTIEFIGTTRDYDSASEPHTDAAGKPIRATRRYSAEIGRVLDTARGTTARYVLTGEELYVRAVVTSSRDHPDPSHAGQKEQAWTQPVMKTPGE